MSVILLGEVVNSCDATTGFSAGNISGDDDFVEGIGAIGAKISGTTTEMYTTTLGVTAPYDFSSVGAEDGYHIIMWFNTKTPIDATTGLRITVGNGTDRGHWYVPSQGFYKGGFITAVVNTARDFDNIAAGTWTLAGNPGQLTNVTEMGGVFTTLTTIMGSFNNCQLDQFTIGTGLVVDAGTIGTPNTFETVRADDEDTNFWGWWTSALGKFVGKGKLYIGPLTGGATSVFNDEAFSVVFANERVAKGFYELIVTGSNTDCSWSLGTVTASDSTAVRWSLTSTDGIDAFLADSCIFQGADVITLYASSTLKGCTILDTTSISQSNGDAIFQNNLFQDANTNLSSSLIRVIDPSNISGCDFIFSSGHALELTVAGTYAFSANIFTGYDVDETGDAAIFNNTGGLVTINVTNNGSTPTIRNGAGSTTVVNNAVNLVITCVDEAGDPIQGVQVDIQLVSDDSQILNTSTDAGGEVSDTYNYVSDTDVEIDARSSSGVIPYFPETRTATITSAGLNLTINMREDNIIT